MQTATATAAPSGSELIRHTAPTVGARELLEESERLWAADLGGALRCDGSPDSRHRRRLVLEALAAYVRLTESASADPAAVFRRWPACTTVALAALAATAGTQSAFASELADRTGSTDSDPWLAGWGECWSQLATDRSGSLATAPGVPLLRALSAAGPEVVAPQLRLHPETGAITVVFPGTPGSGIGVEAGGPCPVVDDRWVLARPVRRATCHDVLGGVHRLHVVDAADPLLVFDDDGRLIAADTPLPAGEVWLVHLGEPPPDAFDGTQQVLEVAAPPVGWTRWWLGRVSLAATTAIRSVVGISGGPRYGPWRSVANAEQADLEIDAPVPGLFDADGDAVYAAVPRLRLPGRPDEVWSIEVRRDDSTLPQQWSASAGVITLADRLRRPLAGRFAVHAHAPGHRPVRGAFTVVEGLRLQAEPNVRPFFRGDGGLMFATVTLAVPAGLRAPRVVRLRGHDVSGEIRVGVDGSDRSLRLRVELPHCALRTRIGADAGSWSVRPQAITLDEVAEGAELDVRIPRLVVDAIGAVPDLIAAPEPDDPAGQRIRGRRVSTDVYRYRLGGLADHVRLHGTTSLWLATMWARIGRITHALARDVELTGSRLRLIDRARHGKLRLSVCAPLAPWVPPQVAELAEDENEVPLDARLAGRALLLTATPAEIDVPPWPEPARLHSPAVTLRVAGRTGPAGSAVEQAMTRYLAGTAPLPDVPAALPLLWAAAARGGLALGDAVGRLVAQECAEYLAARPEAALRAAGDFGLTGRELIVPMIRAGFAARAIRSVPDPAVAQSLWARAPLAALLLTSPLLPYLARTARWEPAELEDAERDLLAAVQTHCPPAVLALLADPTAIPFSESSHQAMGEPHEIADALADLRAYSSTSPAPALFAGVERRAASGADTDALSLGCGVVARLAAQRDPAAIALDRRLRPAWVAIAHHTPTCAMNDLVAAEFAVSGWYARHG